MVVVHTRSGVRGVVVGSWLAGEGRQVVDLKVLPKRGGMRLVTLTKPRFDREWRQACDAPSCSGHVDERLCCTECGAGHGGDPCEGCGRAGRHAEWCPAFLAEQSEAA